MINKIICSRKKTLLDALQKINANGKGILFVVDEEKKLCGILTDGDIRRLLLKGHNLQEEVGSVIKKGYVYAKEGEKYNNLIKKISSEIYIIPIVDKENRVVDYFEYKSNIHLPIMSPHLKGNELKYLIEAFLSTWISSKGNYIGEFEKGFSGYHGCKYGIATSSGTTALHLALKSLDIGMGDEVIVPDLTFVATINAVLHANAVPVVADVKRNSWCINPEKIEEAVTSRTKAIIPVHLYGQPSDMQAIMRIAKKHNLYVIEDCAEAHGASFNGRRVGSFGDIGCFSFFGNKIVTTGEGGMCTTDSKKVAEKMKILRDHGMNPKRKYWHDEIGYNYRMTNLQASIGTAQLERLGELLRNRQAIEDLYKEKLEAINWLVPQPGNLKGRKKVVWYVNYLVDERKIKRDLFIKRLKKSGIETRPLFYPLSKMEIYKKYIKGAYPVSQSISKAGISFPTNLSLRPEDYERITSTIGEIGAKIDR